MGEQQSMRNKLRAAAAWMGMSRRQSADKEFRPYAPRRCLSLERTDRGTLWIIDSATVGRAHTAAISARRTAGAVTWTLDKPGVCTGLAREESAQDVFVFNQFSSRGAGSKVLSAGEGNGTGGHQHREQNAEEHHCSWGVLGCAKG